MTLSSRVYPLALTVALAGIAISPLNATSLHDGLLGYWSFDGTSLDYSGGGRDLTLVGNPSYGPGPFAGAQALVLDGIDDCAKRLVNDQLFDLASGDFTIQIWVNFTAHMSEDNLIEKFTGSDGPGWTFTWGGTMFTSGSLFITGGTGCEVGTWCQFAVRRTGNTVDLLKDATVAVSSTFTQQLSVSEKPLLIGRRDGSQGFFVAGSVAETAIWNRALSDAELSQLHLAALGEPVPEPSSAAFVLAAGVLLAIRQSARRT